MSDQIETCRTSGHEWYEILGGKRCARCGEQQATPILTNQVLAEFHGEFTIDPEHFRMRPVICETCGFHIGAFNLYTYRDDPDRQEKIMRDYHTRDVHPSTAGFVA